MFADDTIKYQHNHTYIYIHVYMYIYAKLEKKNSPL